MSDTKTIVNWMRTHAKNFYTNKWKPVNQFTAAADLMEEMEARNAELENVIGWANNSLYGSHGFFLSLNGREDNEHHLDSGIENLKKESGKDYSKIIELQEVVDNIANGTWNRGSKKDLTAIQYAARHRSVK